MMYRHPHLVGTEGLDKIEADAIYVAGCFMSSGKQHYVVQNNRKFFVHQTVADYRREEILFRPFNVSTNNHKLRMPTVFNAWYADDYRI
jgi:hypothetical protein